MIAPHLDVSKRKLDVHLLQTDEVVLESKVLLHSDEPTCRIAAKLHALCTRSME